MPRRTPALNKLGGTRSCPTEPGHESDSSRAHEYESAFFSSATPLAILDARTGRIDRANRKFCELLGYSAEELSKLTYRDLTHPDDLETSDLAYARTRQGEEIRIDKRYLKECPVCHSKNIDYLTRIIGYLKRVSNFSEARQSEAHRRFYAGIDRLPKTQTISLGERSKAHQTVKEEK